MWLIAENLDWSFAFYRGTDGRVYLEALGGSHLMYTHRMRLTDGEWASCANDPEQQLLLARDFVREPSAFRGRVISDEEWRLLQSTGAPGK